MIQVNLQLDCNDMLPGSKSAASTPAPTSVCVAAMNTVVAGFTAKDLVAGLVAGVVDCLITYGIGKLSSFLVEDFTPEWLLGPELTLVIGVVGAAFPVGFQVAQDSVELAIGWFFGTPLGYSPDPDKQPLPLMGNVSKYGGKLNDKINEWISPGPKLVK